MQSLGGARGFFSKRPFKPGIIGLEMHIPQLFVSQRELERFDGVASGKYTKGLGQTNMAVCDVDEDIQSMALSATQRLLNTYGLDPRKIGRLEVGTESAIDNSKSVKTTVMSLLNAHGVYDVEGVDTTNACYGGTQALFNTIAWMHSPEYDGRYGIVLAGDIAVYPPGPARPTGGAGMVALLLGPNAPLTLEPTRHTHMEHAYDFYKPVRGSEYPLVDGHLSNECYMGALDSCLAGYLSKSEGSEDSPRVDYAVFHQPYAKLVKKSHVRLVQGLRRDAGAGDDADATVYDRLYTQQTEASTYVGKELGNLYAGSLYAGLLSNLCMAPVAQLLGSRTLMFSYGSGLAATLFSLRMSSWAGRWILGLRERLDLAGRLEARVEVTPKEYTEIMQRRENADHSYLSDNTNLTRASLTARQVGGCHYLQSVDPDTYQRVYGAPRRG